MHWRDSLISLKNDYQKLGFGASSSEDAFKFGFEGIISFLFGAESFTATFCNCPFDETWVASAEAVFLMLPLTLAFESTLMELEETLPSITPPGRTVTELCAITSPCMMPCTTTS